MTGDLGAPRSACGRARHSVVFAFPLSSFSTSLFFFFFSSFSLAASPSFSSLLLDRGEFFSLDRCPENAALRPLAALQLCSPLPSSALYPRTSQTSTPTPPFNMLFALTLSASLALALAPIASGSSTPHHLRDLSLSHHHHFASHKSRRVLPRQGRRVDRRQNDATVQCLSRYTFALW